MLKGGQGKKGDKGPRGDDGGHGRTGSPGPAGFRGTKGFNFLVIFLCFFNYKYSFHQVTKARKVNLVTEESLVRMSQEFIVK